MKHLSVGLSLPGSTRSRKRRIERSLIEALLGTKHQTACRSFWEPGLGGGSKITRLKLEGSQSAARPGDCLPGGMVAAGTKPHDPQETALSGVQTLISMLSGHSGGKKRTIT